MALSFHQEFQQQFLQLSQVLQHYQAYWRLTPFTCTELPWTDPRLQQVLHGFSDQQIALIDQNSQLQQQYFSDFFPQLFNLPSITSASKPKTIAELPFWLTNGITGRKLGQIEALCQHWHSSSRPIVEWCAGKGHLGRMLAYRFEQPVISLEWQQELCQQGEQLANQFSLPQHFIQVDVLSSGLSSELGSSVNSPLAAVLKPKQHVVALHACGQLHISMLQQAVQAGCEYIHLAPCCYHLIAESCYQPLSDLAQQHNLVLDQQQLKLIVQGQVTAGERIERLRHTEVHWRLSYELLRQHYTGDSQYRPLASAGKHWFSADFSDFATWAAQQHQWPLPDNINWQVFLSAGAKRQQLIQRIELVRHLFRRPLEHWLLLDKMLYLQQHGYTVDAIEFCDYQLTPRNLLLTATKN